MKKMRFFYILFTLSLLIFSFLYFQTIYKVNTRKTNKPPTPALLSPATIPVASLSASVRLPIFIYHYVEHVKDKNDTIRQKLDINPELFSRQLATLKEASYTPIFARELGEYFDQNKPLPPNPIMITFDDGYSDFYTDVLPILKKYGMKVTIYIVPGFLDRPNFLTKNELLEIRDSGLVEIASHSIHHVDLKRSNPKTAREEIAGSKKMLEDLLGQKVTDFAYPYGSYSSETASLVQTTGYLTSVITKGNITQSIENRFALFRLRPEKRVGKELLHWLQNYQDKKLLLPKFSVP